VLPEYLEYERAVATWMNARLGPLMQRYLDALCVALPRAQVTVMQSSAGTVAAKIAATRAVHLLLSGPAGGVLGAAWVGAQAGATRLLTFDMGGTSTDVALVDGAPRLTTEASLGGMPVSVPMVDMHTIGAGGGSIAWCDAGGALQVGPQSAGADPGPACYGNGGTEATVTDAHAVLGHLPETGALAGTLRVDVAAAHAAVAALGKRLGLDPLRTAAGILRIADEHMAQALRVISVERGEDPADYALFLSQALAPHALRVKGEAAFECEVISSDALTDARQDIERRVFDIEVLHRGRGPFCGTAETAGASEIRL